MAKLGDARESEIIVNLLSAVERDGSTSQRRVAAELGVAVGLVNLYLRRCVQKGLVKVSAVPSRRYAYYLTPHGFAEKARLTIEFMTTSASFFRKSREDLSAAMQEAKRRHWTRIGLVGACEFAELAIIGAHENDCILVAIADAAHQSARFVGIPVVRSPADLEAMSDGAIVTALSDSSAVDTAIAALGEARVILPSLVKAAYDFRAQRNGTAS